MRVYQKLRIVEVVDLTEVGDQFAQAWKSFDQLKLGDVIGTRHSGEQLITQYDAIILFPNPTAFPGNEWFYLAQEITRF